MEPESAIDPATIASYRAAQYCVEGKAPMTLLVDTPSADLAALYARLGVASAAFITAVNPCGEQLPEPENLRRNARFEALLVHRKLPYLHGAGRDSAAQWPAEPSFLILGITLGEAEMLGRQYAQNAIIWCAGDATPTLVLLR